MSAAAYQLENVSVDPQPYADATFDLLSEAIDCEAENFTEPARFRAAVYRVLASTDALNLDEEAHRLAWLRFERVLSCLEHFSRPLVTIDAIRVAGHLADEHGVFASDLAKKHNITRQSFHKRVLRVCKFLGLEYRRTKPHNFFANPGPSEAGDPCRAARSSGSTGELAA